MAVEQRELENEKALEQLRTERDIAFTAEAKRREIAQVQKELALEQERRDREIALIDKAREAEIAEITRNLARERAERDKDIDLAAKERERQEAEIARATAVAAAEERARDQRHQVERRNGAFGAQAEPRDPARHPAARSRRGDALRPSRKRRSPTSGRGY